MFIDKMFFEPHLRVYCFHMFYIFVLRSYNGKYFKCETFIKIFSKKIGESKTSNNKQQALLNVSYRCFFFYFTSVKYERQFYQ